MRVLMSEHEGKKMQTNLTDAVEDYLKAIYELTQEECPASTNEIAERLGVAPASVTGMLKRLAAGEPPLLEYTRHHGATLTEQGRQAALEVIRHHRLLELFLQEKLGYSWDKVHAEADRLEHVISEEFEESIARALGEPLHDPHGDPIPTRELSLPVQIETRLNELRGGQRAVIRRVRNDDPELLRYLQANGLVPQARVEILEYSAFDDNLRLQVDDHVIVLGARVTGQIYVEVL
jgi:DtxR family Mn-dependent transcriptional regulator